MSSPEPSITTFALQITGDFSKLEENNQGFRQECKKIENILKYHIKDLKILDFDLANSQIVVTSSQELQILHEKLRSLCIWICTQYDTITDGFGGKGFQVEIQKIISVPNTSVQHVPKNTFSAAANAFSDY